MTVLDSPTTGSPVPSRTAESDAQPVAERLLASMLGALDLYAVYLGERLGWYASLRDDGPATAEDLARRTSTDPRYCREWLEQQAVTGLLVEQSTGTDRGAASSTRVFALPEETAEVLLDESNLMFLGPVPRMLVAVAGKLPELLDAYRLGGGVGWGEYGPDARESQAALNRPWYESRLADALASVPDLHACLARPGAAVVDLGCGGGWSTMALARAYPDARVQGYDIDPPTVDMARLNAEAAGMEERVAFTVADGSDMPSGRFDVVFAFECVHDMPHPVDVLAAARRSLRPGGCVVVMDEAVADEYAAPGDDLERLMYGFSLFVCLPDGMAHPGSAATGTVMRRSTMEAYAAGAGFSSCEVLPIEGFGFWRFYRLAP